MGHKTKRQLIYIVACLLIAAGTVNVKSAARIDADRAKLSERFSRIDGWTAVNDIVMQRANLTLLDLDDYIFRSYQNSNVVVSLYVGYYYTADKVGAAHSPLVCFPGQGWQISPPESIDLKTLVNRINAEKLLITKGQYQELVVYWYQAYDKTSPGTFLQKIYNFWARIHSMPEDNAFVRVSVKIQGGNREAALESAEAFIQDFYPKFLDYIYNGQKRR